MELPASARHGHRPAASRRRAATLIRSRTETPVAWFVCPSRRRVIAYPNVIASYYNYVPGNVQPKLVAQSDYAASVGQEHGPPVSGGAPHTLPIGDGKSAMWWQGWPGCSSEATGVMYFHGGCNLRDVTDGVSNTYMAGEKYISTDDYTNSGDMGTDDTWDQGYDYDNYRMAREGHIDITQPYADLTNMCAHGKTRPAWPTIAILGVSTRTASTCSFATGPSRRSAITSISRSITACRAATTASRSTRRRRPSDRRIASHPSLRRVIISAWLENYPRA